MCNNTDALKQIIDTGLVLDGETGLTLTGWNENERDYGCNDAFTNKITTKYGIVRGAVTVRPGGSQRGGFGFDRRRGSQEETPLTLDRLRGILVTCLAVSHTSEGQNLARAFAVIVEKLTENCFHPLEYDLSFEAGGDPSIRVAFTNGMVTVGLEAKPVEEQTQGLKLELPTKYILGRGFSNVLLGESDRGYSNTGLTVLRDGKWERLTGISARPVDEHEEIVKEHLEIASAVALVSEPRRELITAVLSEIIRQLSTLGGDVHIYQLSTSHSEYRSTPSVQVYLVNPTTRKHYSLDFAV